LAFTERKTVEEFIIKKLEELGWTYVPGDRLERTSLEEPLLIAPLKRAIRRLNPHARLTDDEVDRIVEALRTTSVSQDGLERVMRWLKDGYPMTPESTDVLTYISLIDYENVDNNKFVVANQVSFGRGRPRPDIILYVNGIPLVLIECKSPLEGWEPGYLQVKRYEHEIGELFKYVQFSIAAADEARYWANTPWKRPWEDIIHAWREEGIEDQVEATVVGMLAPNRLLDLVRNFIFMKREHGEAYRVIARYMQFRATNKIVKRVIDNLTGKTDKNKGLIWHWQGSGKTFTMVFTALKLQRHPLLENPTIFVVVDRRELEEQLYNEFTALGVPVERITSIRHLTEVLKHDQFRGKRGIFLTLIQKFRPRDIRELEAEVGHRLVLERKNIVVLVDEGHRSQYGSLASEMRRILPNAFFFAFTGTPIAKVGRDTFRAFSYPDEKYMDRYFIEESIKDGFTLPIYYQPRLPEHVHLRRDLLNFFLEQEFEEIPEEYRGIVEDRIADKFDNIKDFLKMPKRVRKVLEDVVEHFRNEVEPRGLKGMIVTVDREACVRYKRILDELLPLEYSEVVMTMSPNDPPPISDYRAELEARYGLSDMETIRKEIVRRFKEEDLPKLLIVTAMLLTGFDAPVLQVMYLDKPMKEHRLLQAIARTNRPYKGVKCAGLVLDYVGIFGELRRALAMYHTEDIKSVAFNVEELKRQFRELIEDLMDMFKDVRGLEGRRALNEAKKRLLDPGFAREFERKYRELRLLYELIAPDPLLAEYYEDYKWLTEVYIIYCRQFKGKDPEELERYVRTYFRKTIDLVNKAIDIGELRRDFPILALDEECLRKIEEMEPDVEYRTVNLITLLRRTIVVRREENPLFKKLADKVEHIVREWNERLIKAEEAYRQLSEIVAEYNRAMRKKRELGLSDVEFFSLLTLRDYVDLPEGRLLSDIREFLASTKDKLFEGWTLQRTVVHEIEKALRTFIASRYGRLIDRERRDELHEKLMSLLKRLLG